MFVYRYLYIKINKNPPFLVMNVLPNYENLFIIKRGGVLQRTDFDWRANDQIYTQIN